MYLSKHFSLQEFIQSRIASKRGIRNIPPRPVRPYLERLAAALEVIREHVLDGKPLLISSGYRCPTLNKAVGGQPDSNHMYGCAADIYSPRLHARDLFFGIRSKAQEVGLIWDECLLEKDTWVHFAIPVDPDKPEMKTLVGKVDARGKMMWRQVNPYADGSWKPPEVPSTSA